jgi:hypothetical protein
LTGGSGLSNMVTFSSARYPQAPRETGFTLFQLQILSTIGRYTSVHIRKPANESDAIFVWTTEPD